MTAYLNVDVISNAAELINSTLISKGHTSKDLKFVTTNWAELINDQPDQEALQKLTISETIYQNDKNVVNAIYSLLQSIDKHNKQHEASMQVSIGKDAEIARLEQKLHKAESETAACEKKLSRLLHIDSPKITQQNAELTRQHKAQAREIQRLKNLNADLQSKYEVEKRRMALENSGLKSALLQSRGLSTTISYGRPLDYGNSQKRPKMDQPEVNPNIVHSNKPTVDNPNPEPLIPQTPGQSKIIDVEYDGIATQLSGVIERLMVQNSKYAKFARELTHYIENLNKSIRPDKILKENGFDLVNPAQAMDLKQISADTNEEVEPFEQSSAPLLKKIFENYDSVSALVELAVSNTFDSETLSNQRKQDRMELLEKENSSLSSSLQEALKALEEWRSFKNKK